MNEEDIKYINLIIKEIITQVNSFKRMNFPHEKAKLSYIANVITRMNLFLGLISVVPIDDQISLDIAKIIDYNLHRLIEISDYTEDELENAINGQIKK